MTYCGWKKSCTTLDGWTPINNGINGIRINHLPTGAGFLPSTVFASWLIYSCEYIPIDSLTIPGTIYIYTHTKDVYVCVYIYIHNNILYIYIYPFISHETSQHIPSHPCTFGLLRFAIHWGLANFDLWDRHVVNHHRHQARVPRELGLGRNELVATSAHDLWLYLI